MQCTVKPKQESNYINSIGTVTIQEKQLAINTTKSQVFFITRSILENMSFKQTIGRCQNEATKRTKKFSGKEGAEDKEKREGFPNKRLFSLDQVQRDLELF